MAQTLLRTLVLVHVLVLVFLPHAEATSVPPLGSRQQSVLFDCAAIGCADTPPEVIKRLFSSEAVFRAETCHCSLGSAPPHLSVGRFLPDIIQVGTRVFQRYQIFCFSGGQISIVDGMHVRKPCVFCMKRSECQMPAFAFKFV